MNIKEAKEQISNAMRAYFTKDPYGAYRIPPERQRPVFLMGPPGIGKTAIMEQVAQEMGVALVSYSMTHHTRQSALGLPFIAKKNYGGVEYDVSEYTMSEIIASVYDRMEETGLSEGILFLDEINCVSETLAPAMLQFLQYKIFGRHRVPEGWIVVTAGNPPEYNRSVREFDIVTWDRLKRIDVEPDYGVWREYAIARGTHPAVVTYLDIKKADFYRVESTVDGKSFVTARGWSDLSDMLILYEENGIAADEKLVCQYLQNARIAKDFAVYYDLFRKYRADYQVDRILAGSADPSIAERAKAARFDERLALLGLLTEAVAGETKRVCVREEALTGLMEMIRNARLLSASGKEPFDGAYVRAAEERRGELALGRKTQTLSQDRQEALSEMLRISDAAAAGKSGEDLLPALKGAFASETAALKQEAALVREHIDTLFTFMDGVWPEGQELLILVTDLTSNPYSARFIGRYGSDKYFSHNRELLFYERQKEIIDRIDALKLED